jgi:hypothetical protein
MGSGRAEERLGCGCIRKLKAQNGCCRKMVCWSCNQERLKQVTEAMLKGYFERRRLEGPDFSRRSRAAVTTSL